MELSLGRRADYAIRAALALARSPEARRKTREIAEEMSISANYLPQIMAALVHAGLVRSIAGPHGGYALARPAAAVTLLDVIEAVEGEVTSRDCVLRGGPCRWDDICAVHVPWARAQQALLLQLDSATLATVAALDAQLEAGTFTLPPDLRGMAARRQAAAGEVPGLDLDPV